MQTRHDAFETVVSTFQIALLASLAKYLGRSGVQFVVGLEYKKPSKTGTVGSQTCFPATGMPFELVIVVETAHIWIDLYTNGADAYETQDGTYSPERWQLRCEAPAFQSLNDLAEFFLFEIDKKLGSQGGL